MASSRDIKLINMPDDTFEAMRELNPGYTKLTIKGGSYPGQDEDVQAVGYATHIIARCDLDEDVVYNLVEGACTRTWRNLTLHRARDGRYQPRSEADRYQRAECILARCASTRKTA